MSIIVTSRNDNRELQKVSRTQSFLDSIFSQIKDKSIIIEVVIVEWNPPTDKKKLYQTLSFKGKPENCIVRIITVPNQLHVRYPNASKISLFQYIAKNTGIRRAQGEYIVSTNVDIRFSESIMNLISSKKIKYELTRAVRFDIPASREYRQQVVRPSDLNKELLRAYWPWGDEIFTGKQNMLSKLKSKIGSHFYNGIFTNACGDFTMLSKKDWELLKGYPEYPLHGTKIDGLLIHAALKLGLKQKILYPPYSIYHLDHPDTWNQSSSISLQKKLKLQNIPFMSTEEYNKKIQEIHSGTLSVNKNRENWGIANKKLSEFIP